MKDRCEKCTKISASIAEENDVLRERVKYLDELIIGYKFENRELLKLLNEKCAKIRELSYEKD